MTDRLTQELWRTFYARLFAMALHEPNPERRMAYVNAISTLVALSKARKERKERHGRQD